MQKQMLRGALVVILAFTAGYCGFLVANYVALKRQQQTVAAAAPAQAASSPVRVVTQPMVQTPTRSGAPSVTLPSQNQPAASQRRPAPERNFYLTERVSVMTDAGVSGKNPGTPVLLLEQLANGNLKVTDGPDDFEVTHDQITNDPEIGKLAKRQDNAARQALGTWKQRQVRPPLPPNVAPPVEPDTIEAVPAVSPTEHDLDTR